MQDILKYEKHDGEYTMEDNALLFRHHSDEDWILVDIEHCIAEGENHHEVFKYFGKEKYYTETYFKGANNG